MQILSFILEYRFRYAVVYLGWVDIDYGNSTTCPILLRQPEFWQYSYAARQDDGTSRSKSTQPRSMTTCPTLYIEKHNHTCSVFRLLSRANFGNVVKNSQLILANVSL